MYIHIYIYIYIYIHILYNYMCYMCLTTVCDMVGLSEAESGLVDTRFEAREAKWR